MFHKKTDLPSKMIHFQSSGVNDLMKYLFSHRNGNSNPPDAYPSTDTDYKLLSEIANPMLT